MKNIQRAKRKEILKAKFGKKTAKWGKKLFDKLGKPGKWAAKLIVKHAKTLSKTGGILFAAGGFGYALWEAIDAGMKLNKGSKLAREFETNTRQIKEELKNSEKIFTDLLRIFDCIEDLGKILIY